MNVLLAVSKFSPEHSGSGHRLEKLYKRLVKTGFMGKWEVITRSVRRSWLMNYKTEIRIRRAWSPLRTLAGKKSMGIVRGMVFLVEYLTATLKLFTIKHKNIDVVHAAGWSGVVLAACHWSRRKKIPLIRELTSEADRPQRKGWESGFMRRTLGWAERIVAISPMLERSCQDAGFGSKVWCRPNPVDQSLFYPAARDEKKFLRWELLQDRVPFDAILLICVARICPWKNQGFLLEVLQNLPNSHHLLLVGPSYKEDHVYFKKIKDDITKLGLSGRVHLIPESVENVRNYLAASDIFVFPSLAEGLGNVMLEALSCGLPVVANRLDGVTTWIIQEGVNGYLSPLLEPEFRSAILSSRALIADSNRISKHAMDRFSSVKIDAEYMSMLNNAAIRKQT